MQVQGGDQVEWKVGNKKWRQEDDGTLPQFVWYCIFCGNSCKRDNHTVLMVLLYPCNKIVYIGSFSPILKKKKAY